MPPAKHRQTKQCVICGAEFQASSCRHITCSPRCYAKRKQHTDKEKYRSRAKHRDPIPCSICGTVFTPVCDTQHLCSSKCRSKSKNMSAQRASEAKNCAWCGKEFRSPFKTQQYCSPECVIQKRKATAQGRKYETRTCEHCFEEFTVRADSPTRFCSQECAGLSQAANELEKRMRASTTLCPFSGEWKDLKGNAWPALTSDITGYTSYDCPEMDPMSGGFPMSYFTVPSTAQEVAA